MFRMIQELLYFFINSVLTYAQIPFFSYSFIYFSLIFLYCTYGRHGQSDETIGNLMGVKYVCPCGHLHGGTVIFWNLDPRSTLFILFYLNFLFAPSSSETHSRTHTEILSPLHPRSHSLSPSF